MKNASSVFFFLTCSAVFALDRVSKILLFWPLPGGISRPVAGGIFALTRVENTGAAFGLWKDAGFFLSLFAAAFLVLILFIFAAPFFSRRILGENSGSAGPVLSQWTAWALVAGGTAGNLFDRIRYGFVLDFLDFHFWPVFNLADAAISVGAFLLLMRLFLAHRRKNG